MPRVLPWYDDIGVRFLPYVYAAWKVTPCDKLFFKLAKRAL